MTVFVPAPPSTGERLRGNWDLLTRRVALFPDSLLRLLARVAVAAVFWRSGQVKIASWSDTVALFRDEYRVPLLPPEIAALMGTAMELVCPILLLLGIASRLGAAGLLGMTLVIQAFVYPGNWPEHLTWAVLLGLIVTGGPGRLSFDHLVAARVAPRA